MDKNIDRSCCLDWLSSPGLSSRLSVLCIGSGGCYAVNWDLTGSLYEQKDSVCNYNKVQHEAGVRYRELAKEKGVRLKHSTWDGKHGEEGCTCYNMCYEEGTPNEIIHIDRRSESMCICYNTSYSGLANPQHRTVKQLDEQKLAG